MILGPSPCQESRANKQTRVVLYHRKSKLGLLTMLPQTIPDLWLGCAVEDTGASYRTADVRLLGRDYARVTAKEPPFGWALGSEGAASRRVRTQQAWLSSPHVNITRSHVLCLPSAFVDRTPATGGHAASPTDGTTRHCLARDGRVRRLTEMLPCGQ